MTTMRVDLPQHGQDAIRLTGGSRATGEWRIGQILQAVALTSSAKGQVTLQIGNSTLDARTSLAIAAGQHLRLEVQRLGHQPVLKLLDLKSPPADPAAAAWRSALPRQAGLGPLLANLALLAGQSRSSGIGALAANFLQLLPDKEAATAADRLRHALLNSGPFLEARLARLATGGQDSGLGQDLKAGLLRLLNALLGQHPAPRSGTGAADTSNNPLAPPLRSAFPQPPGPSLPTLGSNPSAEHIRAELLRQTEGALARLQLAQLSSLPAEHEQRTVWVTELPVWNGIDSDIFGLRIERDDGSRAGKERRGSTWTVSLAFDLPGLGPVRARIGLSGEQVVSAAFWAEQPETTRLFQEHLADLQRQFEAAGFEVGVLACHSGTPPAPAEDAPRLLDERV